MENLCKLTNNLVDCQGFLEIGTSFEVLDLCVLIRQHLEGNCWKGVEPGMGKINDPTKTRNEFGTVEYVFELKYTRAGIQFDLVWLINTRWQKKPWNQK
jgi:hypothetical protein